jgi:hypothetical protein
MCAADMAFISFVVKGTPLTVAVTQLIDKAAVYTLCVLTILIAAVY